MLTIRFVLSLFMANGEVRFNNDYLLKQLRNYRSERGYQTYDVRFTVAKHI
ncbi:hypothetical protein C5167_036401 [Papaver somniferum]|uniref:Uncharacterized protein n=1 Tax=Papaver somniferum TaxID=3469 RepID=A0A4Y7I7H1_PAPSO|nr:hypothetical protein C5167_036401 [Papaver somniferum]